MHQTNVSGHTCLGYACNLRCPVPFSAKLGKHGSLNKTVSYDWQVLNQLRRLKKYDNHNLPRFFFKAVCLYVCICLSVL